MVYYNNREFDDKRILGYSVNDIYLGLSRFLPSENKIRTYIRENNLEEERVCYCPRI